MRVHQILINLARVFEGFANRALRDLVEGYALDAQAVPVFIFIFSLLGGLLLFLGAVGIEFIGQMRGDGFAFAVRVRRQKDVVGRLRQLLQPGENLLFARDDDVFGIEFVLDIDAQRALGQVFHVAQRGLDREPFAKIFLNGFRLGGRLNDD